MDATGTNIPGAFRGFLDGIGILGEHCTAFHIGNGIVLTAGHCVQTFNVNCPGSRIEWGKRDGNGPYLKSFCTRILSREYSDQNDFAVLKVSPAPRATLPIDSSSPSTAGLQLALLSHPHSQPLAWSASCGVVEGTADNTKRRFFSHSCSSAGGSSGSPVFLLNSAKVIGIHTGSGTAMALDKIAEVLP